jgi:hypothetical protein
MCSPSPLLLPPLLPVAAVRFRKNLLLRGISAQLLRRRCLICRASRRGGSEEVVLRAIRKTEAEEKQQEADLMRSSVEAVAVARDVASSKPTAALDMMRYVNPESSFSRCLRSCCIDLFRVPSVLAPRCFPLRSRRYFSFSFAASPRLAVVSFFVIQLILHLASGFRLHGSVVSGFH